MYKCLLFEYTTGQGLSQRSFLSTSHSHIQYHGMASLPDTLSSREFEARCNSGELKPYWWSLYGTNTYGKRHLARTCRLVCRDWAKQLPLGDPKLRIMNGAVWYSVEGVLRVLLKRHWAWEFREIEWWIEQRHQDGVDWSPRDDRKLWYPKVSVIGPFGHYYR